MITPIFQSERTIPSTSGLVPMAPRLAGQEYRAWEKAGQQLEGTGCHLGKLAEELNRREENEMSLELQNHWKGELGKLLQAMARRSDHENFERDLEALFDRLRPTKELPDRGSPQ